jgi:hypothetical protein
MTDAVFDLAVNRAVTFQRGAGTRASLESWHAQTRFATRIDLETIRAALECKPLEGDWHWTGGMRGSWQRGKARTP